MIQDKSIRCHLCGQYLGEGDEPYVGAFEDGVKTLVFPSVILESHEKDCPIQKEWRRCKGE
jgi:hypothetical protein